MNPAGVATVVVSVLVTVEEIVDVDVVVTVTVLVELEVTDSVMVKVSVSCGKVVVERSVVVVETVEVDAAGVTVFDGVVVVTLRAYHGIVMTADLVLTGAVDFGPCWVTQVTYDLVVNCA